MPIHSNFIVVALCLLLTITSCSNEKLTVIQSDFEKLAEFQGNGEEQQIGVFGGSGRKRVNPITTTHATYIVQNGQLQLDFQKEGSFQCIPPAIGLPAVWEEMKQLQLVIETSSAGKILLQVYGNRTRLIDTLHLAGHKLAHALDVREVPLLGGIESRPLYIKMTALQPTKLTVSALSLVKTDQKAVLVDKWGQRKHTQYAAKITSLEELQATGTEKQWLDSLPAHINLDPFGGFTHLNIPLEKTGFFHAQFALNRWWLVTPEGNPFFSLGVNGVRIKSFRGTADVTRIEGREQLFEAIPPYRECPECFLEDSTYFSFYCWNIRRKYQSQLDWRANTYERLKKVGFNTIGNWSDTLFYQSAEMPYTYTLDTRKDERFVMKNHLPDVFHPEWEAYLARIFAEISRFQHDLFMLGYFVDNEMGWRSISRLDSASHTFEALQGKSEVEQMRLYATRYFSTIKKAIRLYDAHHMYLGCRFTRNFDRMKPVAEAAGQSVDILSINIYSEYPIRKETDLWHEASQKPILIGEHHIPPATNKQFLPHYPAFADSIQQEMLHGYVTTWATYPYALGSHWYQFKDQEIAGRGNGGENQPIGLVTLTDKINRSMAETYHAIHREVGTILKKQAVGE